jgi:putative membrane protein
MYHHQEFLVNNNSWIGEMFTIVLYLLFIFAFILVIIRLSKSGDSKSIEHQTKPLDIAKERYARGEIKKDEFEQIKKDISS